MVDATWGKITPMELTGGVRTVGELEVIAHIRGGLPLVDTRKPDYHSGGSILSARNLPHDEIEAEIETLERDQPTIFFCNGPQCAATPNAIETLLRAGYPPGSILFYEGGMHDWLTLGLPLSGRE